jgi:hypothetical protein
MPAGNIAATGSVIIKYDPDKKTTEITPPQQGGSPYFDSRSYPTYAYYVTPSRIREIKKDATVRLVRQAIAAPIIHTPWTIKANKQAPSVAKEFIEDIFRHTRDWLLQGSIYGALDFGWMPYELVYEPTKRGRITITKFKQLLQDYTTILIYMDSGDFAGYTNWPQYNVYGFSSSQDRSRSGWEIEIDEQYAMNINLEVEGTDWYGISASCALDSLCKEWDDVNKTANRYDKKVAGATWVVWYPVGVTKYKGTEKSNDEIATNVLASLEASGGVAIPDEIQEWVQDLEDSIDKDTKGKWRIELISAQTTSQNSFSDRQKYLDALKVRVFGIPERSLLEGKFGTKAEAETHAEIGLSTVDTKHRLIVQQYNKCAVNKVLKYNWGEKAIDSVWIEVAPIVSSKFNHLKEIYRMVLQSPSIGAIEAQNLDMKALREELSIPVSPDADDVLEIETQVVEPVKGNTPVEDPKTADKE